MSRVDLANHIDHACIIRLVDGEPLIECRTCNLFIGGDPDEGLDDSDGLVCPECGCESITVVDGHASCNSTGCFFHGDPELFKPDNGPDPEPEFDGQDLLEEGETGDEPFECGVCGLMVTKRAGRSSPAGTVHPECFDSNW